jgi:ABC-2 type transport system permease protein
MLSGLYFPSIGRFSPFPFGLQMVASLIPLTIGMDALRKTLFSTSGLDLIWSNLLILAIMAVVLLGLSSLALRVLERKGRRDGTIAVRIR